MKTARVLFLVSRAHGLMAHLLTAKDYGGLVETRSVQALVDSLLSTDYSSELSLVPYAKIDATELEHVFYEKLSKRWYSLLSTSSGGIAELLEAHNAWLEIENTKKVIRFIHGKETVDADMFVKIPRKYQNVNFRALSNAKSMIEVLDLLEETPFRDLRRWFAEYEAYNNPMVLEAELDRLYFLNYQTQSRRSSNWNEIKDIIGTEVDVRNLQLIFSAKYMKLDPRLIQAMMVVLGRKLRHTTLGRLTASDLQEMPSLVLWPSYSKLSRSALTLLNAGQLAEMEALFSRYLFSYVQKFGFMHPNSLAYVLSYVYLCLREAKNLTTLAIGKQVGLSPDSLSSLLV